MVKKKGPLATLRGRRPTPNEEVAAMQTQLEEERAEMNKKLTEQQEDNDRKEEAIRKLGEKFRRVQKGLSRMEKERKVNITHRDRAEKENVHLRKLLHIRDRELQTLNLQNVVVGDFDAVAEVEKAMQDMRIPTTVDVPQPGHKMSIPENLVSTMMTNLEMQLSLRDEHVDELLAEVTHMKNEMRDKLALERMLRESEGQQSLVRAQLDRVEHGYVEAMQSLMNCFENMRKMTASYKMKEAERTEVIWEANRCLAEQRATYLKNFQKMAKELYEQKMRIQDLEAMTGSSDQDENSPSAANKALPLEKLVLDNSRVSALAYMEVQHEKEISQLKRELDQATKVAKYEDKKLLDGLNTTLLTKDQEIITLKEDVSMHLERIMSLTSEIDGLRAQVSEQPSSPATPSEEESLDQAFVDRLQREHRRLEEEINQSSLSDVSEAEMRSLSDDKSGKSAGPAESTSLAGSSLDSRSRKGRTVVARKKISGVFSEDGSISGLESKTLPTLDEDGNERVPDYLDLQKQISVMAQEKSVMLNRLSENGDSIQRLEQRVGTEQATVNLLRTNIDMMEQAIVEKEERISRLILEVKRNDQISAAGGSSVFSRASELSVASASRGSLDAETKLRAEMEATNESFQSEKVIMQEMIRVLNDQVYHAMKAVERDQQRVVNASMSQRNPEIEDPDQRVAALQRDLNSLHKKAQLALQLSQAEVAALKNRLEEKPLAVGEGYVLGLDWLSKHQRSPSNTPPDTPKSNMSVGSRKR